MNNKKLGFSFVELIVSVAILAIISTIGFISYSSYLGDSRDSQRKSDLAQVGSALKVYKQKRGYYPRPGNAFEITHYGAAVALQGKFNQNVRLNTLDKLPIDPKIQKPYNYSITENAQEYEMVATLENEDSPIALLNGTYKTVTKNVLPTISLAIERGPGQTAEIVPGETDSEGEDGSDTRNKFIFDAQSHNLAYDFEEPIGPVNDGTLVEDIILELENKNLFWQNSDFRSCIELKENGKNLKPDGVSVEYQLLDTSNGTLVNQSCVY